MLADAAKIGPARRRRSSPVYDQGLLVQTAIANVRDAIVIGGAVQRRSSCCCSSRACGRR